MDIKSFTDNMNIILNDRIYPIVKCWTAYMFPFSEGRISNIPFSYFIHIVMIYKLQ